MIAMQNLYNSKIQFLGLCITLLIVQVTLAQTPGGVAGSSAWYNVNNSFAGATWNDLSGNSKDVTQATAFQRPSLQQSAINFNPGVLFDGTNDVMYGDGSDVTFSEVFSVQTDVFRGVVVSNINNGGNPASDYFNFLRNGTEMYSGGHPAGNRRAYIRTFPAPTKLTTQPTIWQSYITGVLGTGKHVLDGEILPTVDQADDNVAGPTTTGNIAIGRRDAGDYLRSTLSEVIIFPNNLTPTERIRVNSYLAIKYGITLQSNYYASDWDGSTGTTMWTSGNGFDNDIAGIGRDDVSALNQKQSKSVNPDAILTIGLGSIELTNTANTNTFLADRDFLVWGNDGASATVVNNGIPAVFSEKIARSWSIQETGSVETTLVQIPNSAVTGFSDTSDLRLFVADDAGFNTNLITMPLVQNGDGDWEANFDFDGTKYFAFGIISSGDIMRHGKYFKSAEEKPMKF